MPTNRKEYQKAYQKEYRRTHNRKEYQKEYRRTHKHECKEYKKEYHRTHKHKRDCKAENSTPAARRRKRKFVLKKYGLSVDDYNNMLKLQNYRCANPGCNFIHKIDGSGNEILHVDHNHTTGETRGLLCYQCNPSLGFLNENSVKIRGLADYIDKWS